MHCSNSKTAKFNLLIFFIPILLFVGCEANNFKAKENQEFLNVAYITPDTIVENIQQQQTLVTWDAVKTIKATKRKEKVVVAKKLEIKEVGKEILKPVISEVKASKFTRFTPGSSGMANVSIINIPDKGYLIQNKDTIYAPLVSRVRKPKTVNAGLGVKDNAVLDISYIGIEEGLPEAYSFGSMVDSRGYLWIATYGGGVVRYDGNQFQKFSKQQGLTDNIILSLYEDKDHNIWIGTYHGVIKYDGITFTAYDKKQGLPGSYVYQVIEDDNDNLWFATDKGLGKLVKKNKTNNYDRFLTYTAKQGLVNNHTKTILKDSNGNLWIGTSDGLSLFDGVSFTTFDFGVNEVTSLLEDSDGAIWIGSKSKGLSKYHDEFLYHFKPSFENSKDRIMSLLEGDDGVIWIGTLDKGIKKFDSSGFTTITTEEGLTSNLIYGLTKDPADNIWISTWGGGVCKLKPKSFINFLAENESIPYDVNRITQDQFGAVWFGTENLGLLKYSEGSFTQYSSNSNKTKDISDLVFDNKNNLWITSESGNIIKFDGASLTQYLISEELKHVKYYSVYIDKKGVLWFCTYGKGILRYDGEKFQHLTTKNGLPDNYAYSVLQDSNGNMWFSFTDWLTKFDGKSFTNYAINCGYPNNSMVFDTEGNIWLGGNSVLTKVKLDKKNSEVINYSEYNTEDKIINNYITMLVVDQSGGIWVGTGGGINLLKQNNSNRYKVSSFSKKDGFFGANVRTTAAFVDNKNNLWLGTGRGISKLNLNQSQQLDDIPKLYLTDIDINEKKIDFNQLNHTDYLNSLSFKKSDLRKIKGVQPFFNVPKTLRLPYRLNHLTFTFDAIDWQGPKDIKYQFKLEGLDTEWSPISEKNSVNYRSIDYGTYTFKVRAIGKAGIWSKPISYTFNISAPWWHTLWFRSVMSLLAMSLILTIIYLRASYIRKKVERKYKIKISKQTKLEEGRQLEKERVAKELHDAVLGSLFGVRFGLESLNGNKDDDAADERKKYIQQLAKISDDIRGLSHDLSSKKIVSDLVFIKVVEELLAEKCKLHNLNYKLVNDTSIKWVQVGDDIKFNLYRIIQESLQNVIKHSKAKKVEVRFSKSQNKIELKILDDGVGFKKSNVMRGIGQKNIVSRAEAINGKVEFLNNKEKGAVVNVSLEIFD